MESAGQVRDLDIGEALAVGWRRFWPNILPMGLYALLVWAVNAVLNVPAENTLSAGNFVYSIFTFAVGQLIAIGWIAITLDIVDGRPVTAESVTSRFKLFFPYAVAAILFAIAVFVGFVAFLIPGFFVLVAFGFYGFHIIDTGEKDPIAALRASFELTRGNRWRIFGLGVILFLLNILGLIAFLIGVLFTSGISLIAIAHAYRQMVPSYGSVPPPPPEPGPSY